MTELKNFVNGTHVEARGEASLPLIDPATEEVCGRIADEGLGIDGAREMHVEIGTFRHSGEEDAELERALFRNIESLDGTLLLSRQDWGVDGFSGIGSGRGLS